MDKAVQETINRLTAPLTQENLCDYHFGLAQGVVANFMTFAGQQIRLAPTSEISQEEKDRIEYVLGEEVRETFEAMKANDLVEIADGLGDIIYVCLSVAATYGIFMPPIMREICNNNHIKTLYPKELLPNGKLKKPEGHKPPRISELLVLMRESVMPTDPCVVIDLPPAEPLVEYRTDEIEGIAGAKPE